MKPTLKYFILLLLAVALVPYLLVCLYAFPFADDYCFGWTASESIPFIQKFLNQYLYWNGRYTADVLVNLHPLVAGKILIYQLHVFVSLAATPVVLYVFVLEVLRNGQTNVRPKFISLIASLFITLFYLNYQPNLTEGVYWFIGISNYHLGNLLFVLQLTLLLKSFSAKDGTKIFLQVVSVLLLIVSVGFNEVAAMLIPLFYATVALLSAKQETGNWKLWIAFAAIAFLASAFVFFSPGNFVRSHEFENRYDLFHSMFYASLQTVRFLAKWILTAPFLMLSMVVVANAGRIKPKVDFDYRLLLAAMLFVVFIGSFLPYFATGVLGQHRTINFVFFFFILLWVLFLISVARKFFPDEKQFLLVGKKVTGVAIVLSITAIMFTGNGFKILRDFKDNNFRKYETAFYERQKNVIANPGAPIEKLAVIPNTFQIVDVRNDTAWWVDKCMKKYYIQTETKRNEIKQYE